MHSRLIGFLMNTHLAFQILPQPDNDSCGPTCLHGIYSYFGDDLPLERLIAEIPQLKSGGTLAVNLGIHALNRGYSALLYTYNLQMFDPSWFDDSGIDLIERIKRQMAVKRNKKLREASKSYLEYLKLGGSILFEDLTRELIRRYLDASIPILTGLSATYLYNKPREYGPQSVYDSIRGEPVGHFVVLYGYDREADLVRVADPYSEDQVETDHHYLEDIDRVIHSILLGIVTYDSNLLVIQPK